LTFANKKKTRKILMIEQLAIPIVGFLLGILAVKLPYRYNPFRLKFGIGDDSPSAQVIPKVIGWLLIVTCGLWLLGLAALNILVRMNS